MLVCKYTMNNQYKIRINYGHVSVIFKYYSRQIYLA